MSQALPTIIFDKNQIQETVARIAGAIAQWLKGKNTPALKLVSVLEGARPFTCDLVNQLKQITPMAIEVTEVTVKGTDGTHLLETRQWAGEIPASEIFKDALVLLVDDLVDSGKTLELLRHYIASLGAKEIKTAVLFRKFGQASGPVDFCGFDLKFDRKALAEKGLEDYWLFGYGMDLDGKYRELDYVGWEAMEKKESGN